MNNIFLKNVLLKTISDNRSSVLWWSIGIILFNLMVMGFYPSFGHNASYTQLLHSMSPEMIKVFLGSLSNTPAAYLDGKLYFMILPFIFLAFNALFGSATIVEEEKSGLLDLQLSTQIPRWRILLEKFGAMILLNLILGFVSFVSVWLGAVIVSADLNMWHVFDVSLSLVGFGIFFGGLAIGISAVTGSKQISLGITGGLGFASYLLNALAPLSAKYAHLQKLSPFYYYIEHDPLVHGLKVGDFSVLIIFAIIFLIIGLIFFQKRDLVTN